MAAHGEAFDTAGSLRGQRIFITGATGFVGKVLVEKLLWSAPEVGKLILLVRSDSERSGSSRFDEEILGAPIMARLKARHGDGWRAWIKTRIEIVEGDLGRDRFGLGPEAFAGLAAQVDRVVACAATVRFDERLDRALEINTRGVLRTLALACEAGAPMLQVSTCFVSGKREGLVEEAILGSDSPEDPDSEPRSILAALEERSRQAADSAALVAAGRASAAEYGFHDVYTLTKALGERLIERERAQLPVAVVRPAIVESAATEPMPGWIDAVRVADPLLVAYGKGHGRDFPGAAKAELDVVPVDFVVNAMIAALARLGRGESAGDRVRVYQVGSNRHPITLGTLVNRARRGFERHPLRDSSGDPIELKRPRFVDPARYERNLSKRLRRAARKANRRSADRLAVAEAGRLAHAVRLLEIYRPYLDHGARYDDRATQALWSSLSAADRQEFPFDVSTLDWDAYVSDVHIPGLVRFALRAESGEPVPAVSVDRVADAHSRGEFPATGASSTYGILASAAMADPRAIAFQTCRAGCWLRYSYGQAATAATNLAVRLADQYGIAAGDRVVVWGGASPEWVLTTFAVHRLGAVTVPLDPQWPAEEIAEAARLTGAKLICAAPGLAESLVDWDGTVAELSTPFVPEPDAPLLRGVDSLGSGACEEDLACILFTSGTTVAPKAVPLTHGNLLANVRALVPVMESSRERLLSVLPIHHAFEFTVGLLVPLVGGGTISYLAEFKPEEIRWMMGATRPTMLVAVPRLLELLHDGIFRSVRGGPAFLAPLFRCLHVLSALTGGRFGRQLFGGVHRSFGGALRRVATGGAALDPDLGRSFRRMGIEVAEGYGMTETSPVLTVNPWGAMRFGSVGRPLEGVEIDVRPSNGAGIGAGTGEIWVRGGNVMAGYLDAPEASREVLNRGWLNTGDTGFFDGDGYLHIAGRTRDVIVTSAGKNVYPEEVESRYRDLPDVEELVVLGLPGQGNREVVGAVVVPRSGAGKEAIDQALATRSSGVPSYQQIARAVLWTGALPKTTTLKVKRRLLREAVIAGEESGPVDAPVPLRSPAPGSEPSEVEAWVLEALARLTRRRPDTLGSKVRLVELGLDSLARVELMAEVEGRFGLRMDEDSAAALSRVGDVVEWLEAAPQGTVAVQADVSPDSKPSLKIGGA